MCGRFTLASPGARLAALLGLTRVDPGPPRYNVAPTQPILAVHDRGGEREGVWLSWGLGGKQINARSETVFEKAPFRDAVCRRRCLVPADGFYEWKKLGATKQPYHLRLLDGGPFAMAGIEDQGSCAILTTTPNPLVAEFHDRMPVILPPEAYALWLDPSIRDPEPLLGLLVPFPAERMKGVPVGDRVGDPKNDGPELLVEVEPKVEPPPKLKAQLGFDW
ncbi:MAG: SOS response-associated peptidase [Deltaproteobacteria bacterium]|nr:SOS response-associated peptidase [Deltaproteobacteria bacterium]